MTNTNGSESFLEGQEYYRSPLEAMREGPRERFLFVTCPVADGKSPDLLVTVDVDPDSSSFCKIVSVLELGVGDEVHHTGWNACASNCCFNHNGSRGENVDSSAFPQHNLTRSHLIVPCLHSSNIYAVDVRNPRDLKLDKKIDGSELAEKFDMSFFHSIHCAPDGTVLVSCVGDGAGKNKGDFLVLDAATFEPRGRWPAGDERSAQFGYDFWYQPRQGVMVSTEWGVPNAIRHGFTPPAEVTSGVIPFAKLCLACLLGALTSAFDGSYGHAVHIWDWNQRRLVKSLTIEGPEGLIPFEVRFPHNPDRSDAFLCLPPSFKLSCGRTILIRMHIIEEHKKDLVVLGWDVLAKLGPVTFDFENKGGEGFVVDTVNITGFFNLQFATFRFNTVSPESKIRTMTAAARICDKINTMNYIEDQCEVVGMCHGRIQLIGKDINYYWKIKQDITRTSIEDVLIGRDLMSRFGPITFHLTYNGPEMLDRISRCPFLGYACCPFHAARS